MSVSPIHLGTPATLPHARAPGRACESMLAAVFTPDAPGDLAAPRTVVESHGLDGGENADDLVSGNLCVQHQRQRRREVSMRTVGVIGMACQCPEL